MRKPKIKVQNNIVWIYSFFEFFLGFCYSEAHLVSTVLYLTAYGRGQREIYRRINFMRLFFFHMLIYTAYFQYLRYAANITQYPQKNILKQRLTDPTPSCNLLHL
jgi:hypothetical protein